MGNINLSLFLIGGYPPSFNLSTLPPSRLSLKPNSQVTKTKFINSEAMEQARQASTIIKQALKHLRIEKQLLFSMALVRTNPRIRPPPTPLMARYSLIDFAGPCSPSLTGSFARACIGTTSLSQTSDRERISRSLTMSW